MATKFEIDSSEYQFSHGRTPRGRGIWAFKVSPVDVDVGLLKRSVDRYNDSPARISVVRLKRLKYGDQFLLSLPRLTFTEATRLAKAIVQQASYVYVVCSLRVVP